jgi:alpha,alpha-trehalase
MDSRSCRTGSSCAHEPTHYVAVGGAMLRANLISPLTRLRAAGVGLFAALAAHVGLPAAKPPLTPDQSMPSLFADVQRARCFSDQKTFPDAVPKGLLEAVTLEYEKLKSSGKPFDLCDFVKQHFLLPVPHEVSVPAQGDVLTHLKQLWPLLRRAPDTPSIGSSLLPLPNAYIVPGGRFREIYYWDSYFTMLGLRVSDEDALIESMVENFAYLIRSFGKIPNGNRTYYLSRSQPPFFALMVELLAGEKGEATLVKYLPELRAEYVFWTDQANVKGHSVRMPGGEVLTRYYDERDQPRPEAFALDEETAEKSGRAKEGIYRHIRAACESGWDFSSRWFDRSGKLEGIRTLDIVPVDLNCLLWQLESTLARACRLAGQTQEAERYETAAAARARAILKYFWSEREGFFVDYDFREQEQRTSLTLAGVFPLFFKIANEEQAKRVADVLETRFLRPGGLVTSLVDSGHQWDAPNGWAPLQWMAIRGLQRYGHGDLADEVRKRWVDLNIAVFKRTGKIMEKYNVVNTSLEAGGGEYPGQDGFGWTNGVLLDLLTHP